MMKDSRKYWEKELAFDRKRRSIMREVRDDAKADLADIKAEYERYISEVHVPAQKRKIAALAELEAATKALEDANIRIVELSTLMHELEDLVKESKERLKDINKSILKDKECLRNGGM